jgi:hypothetical protein
MLFMLRNMLCTLCNTLAGVVRERIVSKRLLKFTNVSTTPLRKAAALDVASRQSEKHVADEARGGNAVVSKALANKES